MLCPNVNPDQSAKQNIKQIKIGDMFYFIRISVVG